MIPKFRAWDNERKKMCYKVYVGPEGWYGEWKNGGYVSIFDSSNPKNVLMMSTGLKDKNGVEILEGDVVQFGKVKTREVVRYGNGGFHSALLGSMYMDKCEVLGNLHEHPELIK